MLTFLGIALLCAAVVAALSYLSWDFIRAYKEKRDWFDLAIPAVCIPVSLYFLVAFFASVWLAFKN